jgi:hypothetical protein
MRWDPHDHDYYGTLERERDRLMAKDLGCTEYMARQLLALERIATQLEDIVSERVGA